jgi:prepilin-type N-terminal cleavage/methylation domain-containing protein
MNLRHSGFSLIELLMVLAITLTVGMLLFHLFQHNERVIRDQALVMEMQQTARVVASQIADEIRMAGQEVPVYSSNWDAIMAEPVAVIFPPLRVRGLISGRDFQTPRQRQPDQCR